ncbi:MAG: AMP-binding protein [Saccharofermentanales bacterium]
MIVLHYLEETAKLYPDKKAIEDENGIFTFEHLRATAIGIAGYIAKKLASRSRVPILVYLPKGKECIATFLGIAYSRNIYTPIDVRFPFPKIKGIIDSLMPELIVTDSINVENLRKHGINEDLIVLYEDTIHFCEDYNVSKALKKIIDIDPVYIFFTSGSTGIPKGVIITHKNIVDYIEWAVSELSIDTTTIMGNQSPFYFDISTQDIYSCIKSAATLFIIPEQYFSFPHKVLNYIKEKKINFLYWVPSAFINVCSRGALKEVDISCVKQIVFGGEVMPVKYLRIWQNSIPGIKATNVYGPTEATVNITAYHVDRDYEDDDQLPLGWARNNTELLVYNENGELIDKPSIQGELYVRGSCLSPGYWKNPEKTNEAFSQSLNQDYSEHVYRTGDIVHYNENNELVFDGRKDFQIKHLGYRIELAEIERAAISIQEISLALADYDKQNKRIVLFYISVNMKDVDVQRKLLTLIPKYMVPTLLIRLEAFPNNENGKIDRKLLHSKYIGGKK